MKYTRAAQKVGDSLLEAVERAEGYHGARMATKASEVRPIVSTKPVSKTVRVHHLGGAVQEVTEAFDAFAATHRLPESVVRAVQVALDEVLSNTVRHGYGPDAGSGLIEVRFDLREGAIELAMTDDAPPFNPVEVPAPDLTSPLETRPVGGLGVFLVKGLVDAMRYERKGGRNELRLLKKIEA